MSDPTFQRVERGVAIVALLVAGFAEEIRLGVGPPAETTICAGGDTCDAGYGHLSDERKRDFLAGCGANVGQRCDANTTGKKRGGMEIATLHLLERYIENAGHTCTLVTSHLPLSIGTLYNLSRMTSGGRYLIRGLCMIRRASRLPRWNCHSPLTLAFARPARPLHRFERLDCDQIGISLSDVNDDTHTSGPRCQPTCFAPLEAMMKCSSTPPSCGR